MCQYCGCDQIGPIGALMDDHFEIRNLCGHIRRHVEAGERAEALEYLRELKRFFSVHNVVEEAGLYLSMTRFEEYEDMAGTLYDEHDALDALIDDALALADAGRIGDIDFEPLLKEFVVLFEHINHEDNGLFPASAVALDDEDWARCERLRDEAVARLDRPLWSEQTHASSAAKRAHATTHTHADGTTHTH
ncbi:hemerythrin domain-containing protein [Mobilicoccus massiliensis]|uniref:hemerythrin domain-containing protein n=1 Tax=Mobilicoccus massiliensis TaxID=1522310 RepID=UPI000693D077|nr:hemerythrin domain-containing protein [Mobilicoccus massiliensis]